VDETLDESGERAWLRVGGLRSWGTHLYRPAPDSDVNRDFVPHSMATGDAFWDAVLAPTAPAVWDQYAALRLTPDRAKQLQRELADLVARYAKTRDDPTTCEYLLHLAMTPRPRPT
jgi:hypothetical protein